MPIVQGTAYWAKLDPNNPAQKYQTTSREDTEWCLDLGLDTKAVKMIEGMNPSALSRTVRRRTMPAVARSSSSRRMPSPVTVRHSLLREWWMHRRTISLALPLVTGARSMFCSAPKRWNKDSGQVRVCSIWTPFKCWSLSLTREEHQRTSVQWTVATLERKTLPQKIMGCR